MPYGFVAKKLRKDDMTEKKWYTFYTRSRFEKKVYLELQKLNYEAYLPLQKVLRQWKDRKKMVEVPLFSSYIFVKVERHKVSEILNINGVARYIQFNNQPAYLREEEIELIKSFLESKSEIEVLDGAVKEGSELLIKSGIFAGFKGKVLKQAGKNKIVVEIESMNKTLLVTLDANAILE